LVPLALCGVAFAARSRGVFAAICVAGLLFCAAQSLSLLVSPGDARPFLRPGSKPAWGITMTRAQVSAAVAAARSCPVGVPYSGPPLIAMLAGRAMPDDQPDQFIVPRAPTLHAVARAVAAQRPVCMPSGTGTVERN
jgi:hypothetical protein